MIWKLMCALIMLVGPLKADSQRSLTELAGDPDLVEHMQFFIDMAHKAGLSKSELREKFYDDSDLFYRAVAIEYLLNTLKSSSGLRCQSTIHSDPEKFIRRATDDVRMWERQVFRKKWGVGLHTALRALLDHRPQLWPN